MRMKLPVNQLAPFGGHRRLVLLCGSILLMLLMLFVALPTPSGAQPPSPPQWTNWGAQLYDLALEDDTLWLAATGGIIRRQRTTGEQQWYTRLDGLPHYAVYTVVLDDGGNRWFGGDGGLSWLNAQEQWQHFNATNSELYTHTVTALALTADGTLYAGHGAPVASVSRRTEDGAWQWFPDRQTAIERDYARIRQTRNRNDLWLVAGDQVWLGYRAYDGSRWVDHTPAGTTKPPLTMDVDRQGRLWVLTASHQVLQWQADQSADFTPYGNFGSEVTALAVTADDQVWVGWQVPKIYGGTVTEITTVDRTQSANLNVYNPFSKLVATTAGLWGIGDGWVMQPDQTLVRPVTGPGYPEITDLLVAQDATVWLFSGYERRPTAGQLYHLDDRKTLTIEDDQWQLQPSRACQRIVALEEAPNGDLWYAPTCVPPRSGPMSHLIHWHADAEIDHFPLSMEDFFFTAAISDIFAQDQRHLYVASAAEQLPLIFVANGIVMIDTSDTPQDLSDDVVETYPVDNFGFYGAGLVDHRARLWYANTKGLLRLDRRGGNRTWEALLLNEPICDLVEANDGTVFARLGPAAGSCAPSLTVIAVRPDDRIERYADVATLVAADLARVRSATRRNTLWDVGVDGALWYRYAAGNIHELRQVVGDVAGETVVTTIPLPVAPASVKRVEVDGLNRVWLVAEKQLWRYSAALNEPVATATPTLPPTPTATPTLTATPATPRQTVSGKVNYRTSTRPLPNVLLSLPGAVTAQATTNNDGLYTFTLPSAGAYQITPTLQSGSNGISALDAAYIAQCVTGVRPLHECPLLAADTSGDGSLSAFDAAQIAQFTVGLASATSRVGQWRFEPVSRSYAALNRDLTAEDYGAYLVGEVTGNWQPSAAPRAVNGRQDPPLTVAMLGADTVTLSLQDAVTDLFAYQLRLHYDPTGGRFLAATSTGGADVASDWVLYTNEVAPGIVTLVSYGVTARPGDGELVTLRFQPTANAVASLRPTVVQLQLNEDVFWVGALTAPLDDMVTEQYFLPFIGN